MPDVSEILAPRAQQRETGASDRILRAATALFCERGYHGTSVRALTRVLRMEAPSLYYHFPSKQHVLFAILDRTLDDLLAGLQEAVATAQAPEDRLRAAVRFHVLFHTRRRQEAFVSHSELRSLTPSNLRRIVARRDEYEQVFRDLLAAGARSGVFRVPDVRLAAMSILTMCTGVALWFSDDGRLAPEAIADRYVAMILRSVDAAGKRTR
ncbi:MAG TPA: TetR/AcrR family transcriptional regulator [Burkholderiales bacterium]|nr:TetR/AcrR family transcriptional regulator [Burkholderiales bacterium]